MLNTQTIPGQADPFPVFHPFYSLVGRTIQVGTSVGIVSAFNQLEDNFSVLFQEKGQVVNVPRTTLIPLFLLQELAWTQQPNVPLISPMDATALSQRMLMQSSMNRQAHGIKHMLGNPIAAMLQQQSTMKTPEYLSGVHAQLSQPSESPVAAAIRRPLAQSSMEPKKASGALRRRASEGATKVEVFKTMHGCFRNTTGMSQRTTGHFRGSNVPSFEDIEASLRTFSAINTARVSTLRSRYLISATLDAVRDHLPCPPEKYVINAITTTCPICGRAMALNKLGLHENWCKHLECCHGATGVAIAARFRALDRNSPNPPKINPKWTEWVDIEERADMAPMNEERPGEANINLMPLTSKLHWHAVLFHQLLQDGALLAGSVVTQELLAKGLQYYGMKPRVSSYMRELYSYQQRLSGFELTFEAYTQEHVNVIELEGTMCESPSPKWFNVYKKLYGVDGTESPPTFQKLESAIEDACGTKAVNAMRIMVHRKRQVLKNTFEAAGYSTESALRVRDCVRNAYVTCCPICSKEIRSGVEFNDKGLCEHFVKEHGELGRLLSEFYTLALYEKDLKAVAGQRESLTLPELVCPVAQADSAKTYAEESRKMVSLEEGGMHWRSLMFENLLSNEILTPCSVLTQEIVVIGLFYFGLVNQRSPQKFGQYPQLRAFQKGLHDFSNAGYDIYCGVGIKEAALGSSHTRGRPVHATKEVIRRYHHYGLSHKSLQRNDRKRRSAQALSEASSKLAKSCQTFKESKESRAKLLQI